LDEAAWAGTRSGHTCRNQREQVAPPAHPGRARRVRGCDRETQIWHASCRSRWPGEAQEGFVQLEVALPSPSTSQVIEERDCADATSGYREDPHKRSATIEVINGREQVLGGGRFDTDRGRLQSDARRRSRALRSGVGVEGCNGVGLRLAQRLVAAGEPVLDVPAKLAAQARVFSTGQGRKTDPVDAHSVALVGRRRTSQLRRIGIFDRDAGSY
jgi:hypothetical protein